MQRRGEGEAPSLDRLRGQAAAIERLARRHRASNVRVFGSVARQDAGPRSDYDLIVDLDPGLRGFEAYYHLDELERELQALLGREVHVVTARHSSDFTRRIARRRRNLTVASDRDSLEHIRHAAAAIARSQRVDAGTSSPTRTPMTRASAASRRSRSRRSGSRPPCGRDTRPSRGHRSLGFAIAWSTRTWTSTRTSCGA